ncbi:hypothetical protein BN1723_020599, partial [Verticillium longisporum]
VRRQNPRGRRRRRPAVDAAHLHCRVVAVEHSRGHGPHVQLLEHDRQVPGAADAPQLRERQPAGVQDSHRHAVGVPRHHAAHLPLAARDGPVLCRARSRR